MQLLFSEPCNLHFGLHAPRTLTIDRSDGPLQIQGQTIPFLEVRGSGYELIKYIE